LEALKSDEALLRTELESFGARFKPAHGRSCLCPFHEDRSPSAGIYLRDGAWHFRCHVCDFTGDIIDVRARANKRTPAEELRAMNDANATRKPVPVQTVY